MSKSKISGEVEKVKKPYLKLKRDENSVLFGENNFANNLIRKLKKSNDKRTMNL